MYFGTHTLRCWKWAYIQLEIMTDIIRWIDDHSDRTFIAIYLIWIIFSKKLGLFNTAFALQVKSLMRKKCKKGNWECVGDVRWLITARCLLNRQTDLYSSSCIPGVVMRLCFSLSLSLARSLTDGLSRERVMPWDAFGTHCNAHAVPSISDHKQQEDTQITDHCITRPVLCTAFGTVTHD